jgi:flagella synthesis protein FlgN
VEATFDPIACIASERDATQGFIDLLQREQRTLQQADISALISLTKEKADRMQQLAQMADVRNRWLIALGHTGNRFDIERILPDYPTVTDVWKDLLQLAEMAVQLNKINGVLIDQRLRYNQQALAVLQAATTQNSGLYGSDGQPQPLSGGRQLGEG